MATRLACGANPASRSTATFGGGGSRRSIPLKRLALDGEILIRIDGDLSFGALQMRLHPTASRIKKLSIETPAVFTAFDTLVRERGKSISAEPFENRRKVLADISAGFEREQISRYAQGSELRLAAARAL